MKPRNFPARKLARQKRAGHPVSDAAIAAARGVRTKKDRRTSARVRP